VSSYLERMAHARQVWTEVLRQAVSIGQGAVGRYEPGDVTTEGFTDLVADARVTRVPVAWGSMVFASDGFLHLARGFLGAAQPELKAALAAAMIQAAKCCQRLFELADEEAGAETRRRLGED